MKPTYTTHILSHTHWDREWYLNSPYTNEWLIPFFDGLFAMLRKEPDYKFILDGQLSMVEDYFEELSRNGGSVSDARRMIRHHVERGALFIGPYYLQPDWQLLSEESLVRNLLIGQKLANSLGGSMKAGWLLDNFGQISQTAQIHRLAGINGVFVWRGVAMDPERVKSEFLWESPDGTRILSIYLLNSYRNVMRLAEYNTIMKERMAAEVEKLKPFATTSNLLMMNGYDQEMIPDDIQPYLRKGDLNGEDYVALQNDPDSYLEAVQSENPDLPVLSGALYNGRFISVFPGVMSSRIYLKIQNDQMQRLLEKTAEPLNVIAQLLGKHDSGSQMEQAWKLLLKNHPHDSICGVSIDDVHKDMENRTRQIRQLGISVVEERIALIAGAVDTSRVEGDEAIIVLNTSLREWAGVVEWKGSPLYVDRIPPLGYTTLDRSASPPTPLEVQDRRVENSHLVFTLNDDGSFDLRYKKTGRLYGALGVFEDMGDSGDEYNYSHPDRDRRYTSRGMKAKISVEDQTPYVVTFRVELLLKLPVSDVNNHTERSTLLSTLPVVNYISVEADSATIRCRTTLRNTVRDHRMRALFPTDLDVDRAYAGSPFDLTERPIRIEDYDESDIPEHVRRVIVGAREAKPSTYFQTRELVALNNGHEGLAVFSKGLPEYQIIDEEEDTPGTIALTLFRSVGWIAKEINTRIGDAGPEIYTPDAQCLREMTFEYAVHPHSGSVERAIAPAETYSTEPIVIATPPAYGTLPPSFGWLRVEEPGGRIKITATKPSEDGDAIVVRGVNLSSEATVFSLVSPLDIQSACLVNLLEEKLSDIVPNGKKITYPLKPKEIFTIKLTLDGGTPLIGDPALAFLETPDRREEFGAYPYTDYVTEEDIESEVRRATDLKAKMDDPMYRRTALEAQLSVILSRHRRDEEEIRRLGYQLNEARVQRRIHDYLNATLPQGENGEKEHP